MSHHIHVPNSEKFDATKGTLLKNVFSVAAVVGPGVEHVRRTETGSDARIDNMRAFTRAALGLLDEALR